jgi:hypothetical protein
MINIIRTTSKEMSELYEHCTMFTRRNEPADHGGEGVTLMTDTGAAESPTAGTAGEDTAEEGPSSGDDGPANAPDSARLLERGVELHALSADEGDCTDEEMDPRDLTPEEAAAAMAVLDAPDENDQEGLALTGGDWFNTIKQVAKKTRKRKKN